MRHEHVWTHNCELDIHRSILSTVVFTLLGLYRESYATNRRGFATTLVRWSPQHGCVRADWPCDHCINREVILNKRVNGTLLDDVMTFLALSLFFVSSECVSVGVDFCNY